MSKYPKLKGLVVASAAAFAMGGAMAQAVPPIAEVANEAMGAGQQNLYGAPMGETGVNEVAPFAPVIVPLAVITPAPVVAQPTEVIVVAPPAPEPVLVVEPVRPRLPEPQVAQAPQEPRIAQEPRIIQEPRMRADRN